MVRRNLIWAAYSLGHFGILATSYGKSKGNAAYNAMADFDRNDIVNIFDFGLLATNYLKMSPIEVP
jgi:hypothetical protein